MENSTPFKQLRSVIDQEPLVIGIGNELRGDDAAGIIIVRKLIEKGYQNSLAVFDTPENYLHKISQMPGNCRLWIDVINWGASPGDLAVLNPDEIQHFAISTHNYSPVVLIEYLKKFKDIPDYFLGIQPQDLALGNQVSQPVSLAIDHLVTFFIQYIQGE